MDKLGHTISLLVIAAFVVSGPAYAAGDPVPPPTIPDEVAPSGNLKRKPATHLYLGRFEVALERTTLSHIQQVIAAGSIEHQGDAGESIYWLCYTIVDASQWQRVWLISGELGGEKHTIDAVAAAKIDRGGPIPAGCPLLPSRYHRLSLDNGVWLGSSRKYLIRRIGTPSREVGPTIDFWYEGKIKVKVRELGESRARWVDFDVGNGLTVQLQYGRVFRLWAFATTTS